MKKTLSIVLLLAMLMTLFTGCSLFGDKLDGTWEAEIDITDPILDGIKSSFGENADSMLSMFEIKDLKILSRMTFSEDGSYEISADKDSISNMTKSLVDQLSAGFTTVLAKIAEDSGKDKESVAGLINEMSDLLKAEFTEEAMSKLVDNFTKKGFYKAKGGKLYTADTEASLENAGYETYELVDNTLTITKGEGLEDVYSEAVASFYPIVYTKKAE